MLNLLTAERIKLFRSIKLWIVLGTLSLLPFYQAVETKIAVHNGAKLVQIIDTVINGATGILMIDKNGFTILLVMSAFISFFIGEEFQHGTIRNALSLGRSRTHYYLSKFVIAGLLSLVGVIVMTIFGMIGYTFVSGFGEVTAISDYFSYAVKTFSTLYLLILSNVSVYVMISFLTKNSGTSLIWSFLYTVSTGFGPSIFQQFEGFEHVTFWFANSFLFYLDFTNPEVIARFPEMILVSLITIMLSSSIGILLFKRTDIK
ncbi:MAG: ABC transporter permease [Bacillota bacterium]